MNASNQPPLPVPPHRLIRKQGNPSFIPVLLGIAFFLSGGILFFNRVEPITLLARDTRYPLFELALASATLIYILPMVVASVRYEHQARQHHRWLKYMDKKCLHCSYDLRQHLPGDLCPECGQPVPWSPDLP